MTNSKFIGIMGHLIGVLVMVFAGFWFAEAVLISHLGFTEILSKGFIALVILGYFVTSMISIFKGTDKIVNYCEKHYKDKN